MNKRAYWNTRFGFYLAAIGSACGLGNLWRFPYVVGENGGGAFVLLYVFFALLIGLPMLIGELMLGKSTRRSVLTAVIQISKPSDRNLRWIGMLAVLVSLVVLSYYAVISGWVLHFSTQFFVGLFNEQLMLEKGHLAHLLTNGWLQMGLASVHLLISIIIVQKGFQEGVEKWIGAMMPIFAVLLILLIVKSLSLPTAPDALRFLFYPDFSRLQLSSPLHALGHVCFTLSIGFGTMVTFGSYLKEEDHIPTAGFRVTLVDTGLSLVAGLLLFPIVLQAPNIQLKDPGLLFEALPGFLSQVSGGFLFGFAFFVCLYLAALGASIGLLEVIVSNLVDRLKISRSMASWATGGVSLLIGTLPALSSSTLKSFHIFGRSLLEILDGFLINLLLPLVALGLAWAVQKGLKKEQQEKLFVDNERVESVILFPQWRFVLKYILPAVVLLALILQILDFVV